MPTVRQLQVLRLVALGHTIPRIARELWISESTVKAHLRGVSRELGARGRTHAVTLAVFRGYLELVPDGDGVEAIAHLDGRARALARAS